MQSTIKTLGHNMQAKLFDALQSIGHRLLRLLTGLLTFYIVGAVTVLVSTGATGQIINPLTCKGIGLVVVGILALLLWNCVCDFSELLIEQPRSFLRRILK